MSQDLPMNVDTEEKGTITYATEVIATIVGVATTEVEGIASMAGAASISELLSGKPKNFSRGVRVEVGAEEVAVDVSVIVDYGMPIQIVGSNVQENIRKSIETMTGLQVLKVDVHVLGVSFEKENKELEQGQEVARLQSSSDERRFGGVLEEGLPDEGKAAPKQKKGESAKAGKGKREQKEESVVESVMEESLPTEERPADASEEQPVEETQAGAQPELAVPSDAEIPAEDIALDPPNPSQPSEAIEPVEAAESIASVEPAEPQPDAKSKGEKKNKKGRPKKADNPDEQSRTR